MKSTRWLLACSLATATLCGGVLPTALAQVASPAASSAGEPYNVSIASYPSAQQATISWSSDASPTQGFRVERRILGSRAWLQAAAAGGAVRSAIDSNLVPQTSYEYRVLALNSQSAGQASIGQVIFTTPAAGAAPADYAAAAVPRRLDVQPLSKTDIIISWTDASSDESGFKVERRDAGGAWRALTLTAANATTFRDTFLQAATTYEYRVSAERPSGTTLPSAPKSGTTSGATQSVFFVSTGGNDANPGTEAQPWKTIKKAALSMTPGQTVLVRAGINGAAHTGFSFDYAAVPITVSGTANAWITYRNFPGERPKLKTTYNKHYHAFDVRDASYIVIDGFEVDGFMDQITAQVATEQNDLAAAYFKLATPKYVGPIVDSNGISISGKTPGKTHHIIIRNNVIHNVPGCGIAGIRTDHVTVENNRVYDTSRLSPYGTSGISFLVPENTDTDTTSYKLQVLGNVVSEASNLYPCACTKYVYVTDGNGIIIDSLTKPAYAGGTVYAGKTLVANNIVFNNGGRGIHAFLATNTDILNNTSVRNSQIAVTGDGEITVQNSKFVRVFNNIMVARQDRPANATGGSTNIQYDHNIVLGGNRFQSTAGNTSNRLGLDPKFAGGVGVNVYRLQANSPAVNTAFNGVPVPMVDVFGAPRPRGGNVDVGAVESF